MGARRRALAGAARHELGARPPPAQRRRVPRCFPTWAHTLGSQFIAHPPIMPFRVDVTDPDHWLVAGIEPFETDDELYCSEYHDVDALHTLLHTRWSGVAKGFEEHDWTATEPDGTPMLHRVMYLRPLGEGSVLYNTLGHCRGHWDMVPVVPYYPKVERGSWSAPPTTSSSAAACAGRRASTPDLAPPPSPPPPPPPHHRTIRRTAWT